MEIEAQARTSTSWRARARSIGEGLLAAIVTTWIMVSILIPLHGSSTGVVIAGVLFWIEFVTVAVLVATRDREGSRARSLGEVVALVLPVAAPLILFPFASGSAWVIALAVVVLALLAVWVTSRRRASPTP